MKVASCAVVAMVFGVTCTAPKPDEDSPPPFPPPAPSCIESDAPCGEDGASCCATLFVGPSAFEMGFSVAEVESSLPIDLAEQDRDHAVYVSGFFLDRFEISVGRFSKFMKSTQAPPVEGSGQHPLIEGSGWDARWNTALRPSPALMVSDLSLVSEPAEVEAANEPMLGLSWFMAFAFCIWDGGRLPTEAEWEKAAAGGAENRPYPWGSAPEPARALETAPLSSVGSNPGTRGLYGHDDLAGGAREWVLDWFSERYYVEGGRGCRDCANLVESTGRGVRGAADRTCCAGLDSEFRSAARHLEAPGVVLQGQGARCARDDMSR